MQKPVLLYTLSTCIHCKNTKKFLDECAVKYKFVDVDRLDSRETEEIINEVRKINPQCSFPTIVIGDTVIIGFKKDEIKKALES